MDKITLAIRIKKIRQYRNYSQKAMAVTIGIRQNTYCDIENGKIAIKQARLEKIARALDMPVEHILNENFELFNIADMHQKQSSNNDNVIAGLEKAIAMLQEQALYLKWHK